MHSTMGMQADSCRIMVRVYANILGLSKVLARAGMVGHEARSLSPFTSSFTRAQDLFDFVDAAEKKEGSDFKIRGMHLHLMDLMLISCSCLSQKCFAYLWISTNAVTSILQVATTLASPLCSPHTGAAIELPLSRRPRSTGSSRT